MTEKIKLIAETAWHHEGDYPFMKDLVSQLCEMSSTDVIKMHITLDFDEYMSKEHDAYNILKKWLLSAEQWEELIDKVRLNGKELMLLLNDTSAIKFAAQYNSELVELHSVCLNVPSLQQAIIEEIEALIVIGSKNSSNSNRLREIAEKKQKPAYLIDDSDDINSEWLAGINSVGVTAGASAPEVLVQEVINYLVDNGAKEVVEYNGSNESMHFPVPRTLK